VPAGDTRYFDFSFTPGEGTYYLYAVVSGDYSGYEYTDQYNWSPAITAEFNPPSPNIISVEYSNEVILGEWATITIEVINDGSNADWMSVALSFPDLTTTSSITIDDDGDFSRETTWRDPGGTLNSNYGSGTVTVIHPLIEASHNDWAEGVSKQLILRVKPEKTGTLRFYLKSVASISEDYSYHNPITNEGDIQDQQNEWVYKYEILVNPVGPKLQIDVESDATHYFVNENIPFDITIQNVGDQDATFYLGVTAAPHENRDVINYHSNEEIWDTLSSGETQNYRVTILIPEDASIGQYDLAVNCWKNPFTEQYEDDLLWVENIFSVAKKIPDLNLVYQENLKSCWAASSEMILNYYGVYSPSISQRQIALEFGNEDYFYNGLPGTEIFPIIGDWSSALERLGSVDIDHEIALSYSTIIYDVDNSKPIIALYAEDKWIIPSIVPYHAVVIAGYVDNPGDDLDEVLIYDPWNPVWGSEGGMLFESWQEVKDRLFLPLNGLRTRYQLEKTEISIHHNELNSFNSLVFEASSNVQAEWAMNVRKWDPVNDVWSIIQDCPDWTGVGSHTSMLSLELNAAGDYVSQISSSSSSSWNIEINILHPPGPKIKNVNKPAEIIFGEWAEIAIDIQNDGEAADWMGVTLGFPDVTDITNIETIDASLFDLGATTYDIGEMVGYGYGAGMRALTEYPLVEASELDWEGGVSKRFVIRVKPERSGSFKFYLKTVASVDEDYSYHDPESGTTDQQDEFVYTYNLNVNHISDLRISVEYTSDLISDYFVNDVDAHNRISVYVADDNDSPLSDVNIELIIPFNQGYLTYNQFAEVGSGHYIIDFTSVLHSSTVIPSYLSKIGSTDFRVEVSKLGYPKTSKYFTLNVLDKDETYNLPPKTWFLDSRTIHSVLVEGKEYNAIKLSNDGGYKTWIILDDLNQVPEIDIYKKVAFTASINDLISNRDSWMNALREQAQNYRNIVWGSEIVLISTNIRDAAANLLGSLMNVYITGGSQVLDKYVEDFAEEMAEEIITKIIEGHDPSNIDNLIRESTQVLLIVNAEQLENAANVVNTLNLPLWDYDSANLFYNNYKPGVIDGYVNSYLLYYLLPDTDIMSQLKDITMEIADGLTMGISEEILKNQIVDYIMNMEELEIIQKVYSIGQTEYERFYEFEKEWNKYVDEIYSYAHDLYLELVNNIPDPYINVHYSSESFFDEFITITIDTTNKGDQAEWMSVSIGFPDLTSTSNIEVVDDSAFNRETVWIHLGETIGSDYGSNTVTAVHPLIEASHDGWSGGVSKQLVLQVKPEKAGTFCFYIKSIARVGEDYSNYDPSWGIVDQQNEFVKKYLVNVLTIEPLKSLLKIEVIGSGTTYPVQGLLSYNMDTDVLVEATPAIGWVLDHWELNDVDVGSDDPYTVTMDEDNTLEVIFLKKKNLIETIIETIENVIDNIIKLIKEILP